MHVLQAAVVRSVVGEQLELGVPGAHPGEGEGVEGREGGGAAAGPSVGECASRHLENYFYLYFFV